MPTIKLNQADPEVAQLIATEAKRQANTINLIASENYASPAVLAALASPFTNKYAEGYPGKRYYPGNEIADKVESLAIARACKLFGAEHANVQALSGGPANLAIYSAFLKPGDKILALKLSHGGHLSHGHHVNFSGQNYTAIFYGVDPKTGLIDMKEVAKLAAAEQPKIIVAGASAYPRDIDWVSFAKIARKNKALLLADISHTAGLIAAGLLTNPIPLADIAMTTTHKSLRGPRGAIIFCKQNYASAIDRAVFPGYQGGPHLNNIAAIAVALKQASTPAFKKYAKQILLNTLAMADEFGRLGYQLTSGGTDTHLLVIDLTNKGLSGKQAEAKLAEDNITVSRSTIPDDPRGPMDPSGIRIGTPAITTRGFKEKDVRLLARLIDQSLAGKSIKAAIAQLCKKNQIN
ncbi:MAG: serine hydroxymethyltransferase [Candidatus Falkowbacteria bacterium]